MDAKDKARADTGGRNSDGVEEAPRDWQLSLFGALAEGACWVLPDGRLKPLNQQWQRLHGLDPVLDAGEDIAAYERQFTVRTHDHRPVAPQAHPLRRAFAGERFRDCRYRIEDRAGPGADRPLLWSSVDGPGGAGHCVLIRPPEADTGSADHGLAPVLIRTSRALAAGLDRRQLMQMITEAATELTGAEFGGFFYRVADNPGETLRLYAVAGTRASEFTEQPQFSAADLVGAALSANAIRRLGDTGAAPGDGDGPAPLWPPARSVLSAPVTARNGDLLGRLLLTHGQPHRFGTADEEAVGALAVQAAIAIENNRATEALEHSEQRVKRRLAELTAIYDTAPVGLALVTPDLRLARVNARMEELVGVSMAAGTPVRDAFPGIGTVLEDCYTKVLANGEPIFAKELTPHSGPAHLTEVWLASFHPVRANDEVLLGVNTVLQDISTQKQSAAQLGLEHGIANALATAHTLEEAASDVLEVLLDELQVPAAALWLLDRESGELRCTQTAARDESEPMRELCSLSRSMCLQRGEELPGSVWLQQGPVWRAFEDADSMSARAPLARACGLASAAGFPVCNGNDFVGVIELLMEIPCQRDPRTERLMASVVGPVATFAARRDAEFALMRSEERLRFALDAANLGTWEWNKRSGEVRWSENMEPIHGMDPGTFANSFQSFLENVHPDDRDMVLNTIDTALQSRTRHRVEYRIADPRGERWVEAKGRVLFDHTGEPCGMAGVCSDISERKLAEERFRLAVEASPSAILMMDADGRILVANRRVAQLFGYERQALIGAGIETLLPCPDDTIHPALKPVTAEEPEQSLELAGARADGARLPVMVGLSAVTVGNQRVALCAISDISERKRAEENIRRVNEQLWRKNQEMEQFVYSVSHDLKSPLVTVTGFVGMLKEDLQEGNTAGAADAVGRIERATLRMSALINDLLQLSRIGRVEIDRQTVSLDEVVSDLEQDLQEVFAAKQATLQVHGPLPNVSADRARVVEAFDNLLSNALKYGCTAPGATITVGAVQQDHEIQVYVRDTGPGIPAPYQHKVFQAFQRLGTETEGTGVGLAIVEKIMRTHGGRAWVRSEPGSGAEFWLAFPERPQ